MISDREAAKRRAEKVVSEISGRVNVALHGSKIEPGLSLHNMFRPAISEMQQKLVETYAQLDGADQAPLHDDLITTISDRVIAFIRSTVAGIRGSAVQNAARLAADLEATVRMSVPTEFDLAVYDAHKEKAALAPPVPTRRKQDKFGILDARTHHYDADYRLGIGMLGVAVIYFDLDHFKAINTKFTEPVVDRELLIQLNQLVADLVEGRGFGYAEGGDEFLILLKNTSLKIAVAPGKFHAFDPPRLTIARELRGLTKSELADLVEKTPSAVSQFETGRARPDPQTLRRLSLALAMPIGFFMRRRPTAPISIDACHFRSLRSATQRDRRRLLSVATLLCELVMELDEVFELPSDDISRLATEPKTPAEIDELAESVRRSWGLGLGPIVNVVRLLEAKGAIVSPIAEGCEEVDAFSLWHSDRPLVFLVLDKRSPSRSRFDAAHELGHLVMHVDAAPASQEVEQQANRFASAFLMPRQTFLAECPRRLIWDQLLEMKKRWKVSLAALVRRAYDLGVYGEATYRRACVQLNQRYNAGGVRRLEPDEPAVEVPTVIADAIAAFDEDSPITALAQRLGLSASAMEALLPHYPRATTNQV